MNALELLLTRNSATRLTAPAPAGDARERIFQAALRAPDHGRLQPWRFLVVEGAARARLGEALARAMQRHQPGIDEQSLARLRANPLRAPLVLVLAARVSAHPKIPAIEQQFSAACAAQNMLLAAHALGFGAIWRTGPVTYLPQLREELGLDAGDQVIGFLYMGTHDAPAKPVAPPEPAAFFSEWTGGAENPPVR